GGLVDEQALADSIKAGHHWGAGFDVYSTEPCTDSPLFGLPQVVVTPHLGASTVEAQDRAGTDVADSVLKALAGEFVPDAVNVSGGRVGEEVAGWLDLARSSLPDARPSLRARSSQPATSSPTMLRSLAYRQC